MDVDAGGQVVAVHLLSHQVVVVVVTLDLAIDGLDSGNVFLSDNHLETLNLSLQGNHDKLDGVSASLGQTEVSAWSFERNLTTQQFVSDGEVTNTIVICTT